ncbi:hypothetical protein LLEC1_00496 [Akanthomyces lecanii]|uniref:Uncharacterized protein n=1 Tax=Cordyceps confragosa TaxID=2714763 RepID=A0A179IDW5_CORDF|nr:hypothetical protein LLEC1_00496 [Akanthomyces lecanii]
MRLYAACVPLALLFKAQCVVAGACNADNCARAVTGTRRGDAFGTSAKADCSSFMTKTVTGTAVTVTNTVTVTEVPKGTVTAHKRAEPTVPTYASACSGTSRYSSACSCWGITAGTLTIHPTSIVTATVTVTGVPGPTYTPPVPSSYEGCVYHPSESGDFDLLDPNSALPIIKSGDIAMVVQEVTDPWVPVRYKTVKPSKAPDGYSCSLAPPLRLHLLTVLISSVFDLQLVAQGAPQYLAIYQSGKVGFVGTSSNGQTYTGSGDDKYITTAFSFTCKGRLTAGIVGGSEFHFSLTPSAHVIVTTGGASKTKRDIPVPDGFYDGIKVPDLSFGECCDGHDICYGTCSEEFGPCNKRFLGCMVQSCARFAPVPKLFLACNGAAASYYLAVQFFGKKAFAEATKELCECKCADKTKTACGDKCVDTSTDPDNCGSCNFHCPSGACTNGACSFNTCTGSTCGAFGPCGPGGSCICASITGGLGFCVNGNTPCSGLAACGTSADCPLGSVCAVGTCCEVNVCITTDACGGLQKQQKRGWLNATLGEPTRWVEGL